MNENEKELAGHAPELTDTPAIQGGSLSATPSAAETQATTQETETIAATTCTTAPSDECAETESPALALSAAAEIADAADNSAEAIAASDKAEVEQAIKGEEALAAKESEEKQEEEKVNYHSLTKTELVDALEAIVEKGDAGAHKKVAAIKQSFYQLRNREIEVEMEEFVEAGNAPESFTATVDPVEVKVKELLGQFRELRSKYLEAEENRLQENLALKKKIIDQLHELADDIDNINLHFPKFQQLQADFKAITEIPAGEVTSTWKSYQLAVEQFYDRLKMNKELRDLDFRKNLETKRDLIEQAKALETEADPVAAFRKLQELHNKWRETGPVAKDIRDSIWDEFREISTVVNKRHQDYFEARKAQEAANEEAKTKLCEQIEAIDIEKINSFKEWDQETQKVLDMQKEWKSLGHASRKANNALFTRFRKKCDEFFQRKAEYFKQVRDSYAENMAKKVALCEKAEALKENLKEGDDIRKVIDKVAELQAEWRKIGSVAHKNAESIWRRFIETCNYLYDIRKKETTAQRHEENANYAIKRGIVDELKAINLDEMDRNAAIGKVRELQKKWNQTGHVPFRQKDALQNDYRQIVDTLYKTLDMRHQQARMSNFEEQLADMTSDQGRMIREREKLQRAYEAKKNELNTAENNMGFFNVKSSAGSSMLRDMERRIKRLREDLELIAQKITALNKQLQ